MKKIKAAEDAQKNSLPLAYYLPKLNLKFVKPFTAILFSLLLMLTPFASLQAVSACPPAKMMACCNNAACHMACCTHRDADSQSAPAVPPPKAGVQNQISLLALAVMVWSLPEHPASSISSASLSSAMTTRTPLYARHCVRLL